MSFLNHCKHIEQVLVRIVSSANRSILSRKTRLHINRLNTTMSLHIIQETTFYQSRNILLLLVYLLTFLKIPYS